MHNGSLRYRITRLIDGSRHPIAVGRFRQKLVGAQLPQLLLTHVKQVAHSLNDRTRATDRPTTVISRLHQFSPTIESEIIYSLALVKDKLPIFAYTFHHWLSPTVQWSKNL